MSAGFHDIDGRKSVKWVTAVVPSIQLASPVVLKKACSDPRIYCFGPRLFTGLAHMQ